MKRCFYSLRDMADYLSLSFFLSLIHRKSAYYLARRAHGEKKEKEKLLTVSSFPSLAGIFPIKKIKTQETMGKCRRTVTRWRRNKEKASEYTFISWPTLTNSWSARLALPWL